MGPFGEPLHHSIIQCHCFAAIPYPANEGGGVTTMKTLSKVICALIWLAIFLSQSAYSIRPTVSFECMARHADIVGLATVTGVSKTPILENRHEQVYRIQLRFLEVIKGVDFLSDPSTKKLNIFNLQHSEDSVALKKNSSYLVFITKSEIGPYVLNGAQGAQEISANSEVGKTGFLLSTMLKKLRSATIDNDLRYIAASNECSNSFN